MGEAFIVRRGGSGRIRDTNAVLSVTVPTGSTVTVTKGGVALTPTMWVTAADNTRDCALLAIKPSLFDSENAWTVTASRSGLSASKTVIVDSGKQYDVKLDFEFQLLTGGVLASGYSTGGSFSSKSGYLEAGAGNNSRYIGYISPKIDATPYASVYIDIFTSINATSGNPYTVGLKASTSNDTAFAAHYDNTYNSGAHQTTIDISNLNGEYYFAVSVYAGNYASALGVRNVVFNP